MRYIKKITWLPKYGMKKITRNSKKKKKCENMIYDTIWVRPPTKSWEFSLMSVKLIKALLMADS